MFAERLRAKEAVPSPGAPHASGELSGAPPRPRPWLSYSIAGSLCLAVLSLLLPSTVTYDPWSWLVWGREILQLDLSTRYGPAWKPLPVVFDTVFALFGEAAPLLWLIVARAGAFLALAIAYRLGRRLAGPGAGIVAAAGLALTANFFNYLMLLGMSEPLLAALALLTVERHLEGKRLQAFVCLFGAALLRPEAWLFLGPYGLYLFRRNRSLRVPVLLMVAALPIAWFLPEYLASGDLFRSSKRAAIPSSGGAVLLNNPAAAVFQSLYAYLLRPVKAGILIALVGAIVRRASGRSDKEVLWLIGLALVWACEVGLLAQTRMAAGEQRFLIVSAAFGCVAGGVGLERLVRWATAAACRIARTQRLKVLAASCAAGLIVMASVPSALKTELLSSKPGQQAAFEAKLHRDLPTVIVEAGGRDRLLRCGNIAAGPFQVPVVAWALGLHIEDFTPSVEDANVVFITRDTRRSRPKPSIENPEKFQEAGSQGEWQVLVTVRDVPGCTISS